MVILVFKITYILKIKHRGPDPISALTAKSFIEIKNHNILQRRPLMGIYWASIKDLILDFVFIYLLIFNNFVNFYIYNLNLLVCFYVIELFLVIT